jgi:hypothetical protein
MVTYKHAMSAVFNNLFSGCSKCPHFAHIELLAAAIEQKLPDCQVRKIVFDPEKWKVRTLTEQFELFHNDSFIN